MRKLAFAYTQYHLLNLINLCQTKLVNDEVDLIAFNPEESGVVQLLDRVNRKNIFNRIIVVNNFFVRGNGIKKVRNIIIKMFTVIKNRRVINRFISGYEYDEFYTYGFNMESTIAYGMISRMTSVKYIYYEEGIGSYIRGISFGYRFYHKWFLGLLLTKIPKSPDRLLLYSPSMLTYSVPDTVVVDRLPRICNVELINYLWDYEPRPGRLRRFILMEQPNNDNNEQVELFHLFKMYDAAVKMHPRSPFKGLYSDMEIIDDWNGTWEIICLNDNVQDSVIVSLCSTACFTPKLLFDFEPVVIFLENILEEKSVDEEIFRGIVNKLKECYRDKNKVIIPDSVEDLGFILEKL